MRSYWLSLKTMIGRSHSVKLFLQEKWLALILEVMRQRIKLSFSNLWRITRKCGVRIWLHKTNLTLIKVHFLYCILYRRKFWEREILFFADYSNTTKKFTLICITYVYIKVRVKNLPQNCWILAIHKNLPLKLFHYMVVSACYNCQWHSPVNSTTHVCMHHDICLCRYSYYVWIHLIPFNFGH